MNKPTIKKTRGNLAGFTIEDTVGKKKVVSDSMQKLSVLFIEKLDFAGNKSIDTDIQNLVGIVENVLEHCRYLHELSCYRCEQFSHTRCHCELCKKDFCERCTSDKAHTRGSCQKHPPPPKIGTIFEDIFLDPP